MQLRRLSWAGVELIGRQVRLLIDPLENVEPLKQYQGQPRDPIVHIEDGGLTHALVTHRHPDHFDPLTLGRVLGASGTVFCPRAMADEVRSHGLNAQSVDLWERKEIAGIGFAAVPSLDWRGDEQIAWTVETAACRIIHCGDTIWHGYWWRIAQLLGPFDCAFLPVNGVIAVYPSLEPSGLPATLTPEQACIATRLLHADWLCPIHYRTFHNPPSYAEQDNIIECLRTAAHQNGVKLKLAAPGEAVIDPVGVESVA